MKLIKYDWLKKKQKTSNEVIYEILFSIVIIIACLINIDKAIMPYCVSDEIGYWTAAAWLNNVDWSPLMSHSQYYGWGYGILLALIFKIPDPIIKYRVAIIINSILLLFLFRLLTLINNILFISNKKEVNVFIAGMASLFSYNVVFAHTNMCENFLALLFVLCIYAFIKFIEKPNILYFLLFAFVLFLQNATHLRAIVCIIAVFPVLVYMICTRKINIKWLFIFIVTGILVNQGVYLIKDLLVQNEYTSNTIERLTGNEGISTHLSIFEQARSLEFWYELIISFIGKIFYLMCATAFTIIGFFGDMIDDIRSKLVGNNKGNVYLSAKIYICFCFLGALAVDAIYTMRPYRIDALLYGRYVEYVIPVMICIGTNWLIKVCKNKKILLIALFSVSFLGKIVLNYLENTKIFTAIPLNVSWFSGWITENRINEYYYYTVFPMFISFCIILLFILLLRLNKVKLACSLVALCWIISAEYGWLNTVTPQIDRMNEVIETVYEVKNLNEKMHSVIPLSLNSNMEEFVDVSWLQYQMGETTLYEIDPNDLSEITTDLHVVIWNKDVNYNLFIEKGTVLWSNSRFSILRLEGQNG